MNTLTGFIAYPSVPTTIGTVISSALLSLVPNNSQIHLDSWPENDIAGRFLVDPILQNIKGSDVLIADITYLNFNVVFEIGYAIGRKKRLFLIRNASLEGSDDLVREVGIFDTLGYSKYSNSAELVSLIKSIKNVDPIHFDSNNINTAAPVYLVLPRTKTDVEVRLVSRIKKAKLFYRSFDGGEQTRLSAGEAIEGVAQSHGVVLLLLPKERREHLVQNMRTAFAAGLATAMEKELLILQSDDDPIPLDYRDLVHSFNELDQINGYVADFSPTISGLLQRMRPAFPTAPQTFLEQLTLGASSAENEMQDLQRYYIETDEFRRALRGEVRVVSGRKGAGKTALFIQVRNRLRADKRNVVVDLKPEGFQLIKFKEQVLDYLAEGTQEHTITAFWEYLMLLEICYKLLEKDREVHVRDSRLYGPYRALADAYKEDEFVAEGDFSERMLLLTQRIADDFAPRKNESEQQGFLRTGEITELLYKHNLAELRSRVVEYMKYKEGLWILFDNLDKGWPPNGVMPEDVLVLRSLVDALAKLERDFRKSEIACKGSIFIRHDVFELLIQTTSDRGKTPSAVVDWTDPELLREMLRRRFLCTDTSIPETTDFKDIWNQIAVSHIEGEETSQYLIDRCLMRPRAIIDFVRFCRGHAVNLGHEKIEVTDIIHGEDLFSHGLVTDIGLELRDVFPSTDQLLYDFMESPEILSGSKVIEIISKSCDGADASEILSLLLWYGFLGIIREDDETTYIYSVKYDKNHLNALLRKRDIDTIPFRINPAFWKALEIRH